jgi:hypothetical protein
MSVFFLVHLDFFSALCDLISASCLAVKISEGWIATCGIVFAKYAIIHSRRAASGELS